MTDRWTPNLDDGDRARKPDPDDDVTPPRGTPGTAAPSADSDVDRDKDRNGGERNDAERNELERDRIERNELERDGVERDGVEWDGEEEWDEPNYFVRRILLVVVIVAAILVVAFVVRRFAFGDDPDDGSNGESGDWNTIVVVNDDQIRLLSRDSGDEVSAYDVDDDLLDVQSLVAGTVLVTLADEGRIDQIDLTDGSESSGRAGRDATLTLSPDNPTIALVGADTGGDVTIVRTAERDVFGIADVADLDDPRIDASNVRINPGGTHVAVPVPNLFQSVVIDLDTEMAEAFAGRVIAIDDERVVTEQPAGDESEIEFYDLLGERLGSVDVAAPSATTLTSDGELLMVESNGSVSIGTADGDVTEADDLVGPDDGRVEISGGSPTFGGDRLLAMGAGAVFVVDGEGRQLGVVEGRLAVPPTTASRCAIVGAADSSQGGSVVDLETGEVAAEFDRGTVTVTSLDGCTVAITVGRSPRLVTDGEIVDVDADAITAVAPDGSAYIVEDGRDTELVRVDSDDTTEIADEPVVVRFGRR